MSSATFRARRPGLWAVATASLVAALGVLPVFLLGAVAVLVRADLGFGEAQLGIAVSVYFAAAAAGAVPAGRLVERLGAPAAMAAAAALTGVVMLGIASAWSWPVLLAWMVAGGLANAMSQLGANLRLSGAVRTGHQGLAFGIKQSAVPAGTLLAGAAVPAVGITLGWRWAFGMAAALALGVAASQARAGGSAAVRRLGEAPRIPLAHLPLIVLAAAGAFGAAAATAMAAFVVEYAVAVGVDAGTAGIVLAVGSVASIVTRVALGWLADQRTGGNLLIVIAMMLVGAAAVASFPLAHTPVAIGVVTVLAYAIGWGWAGLFNYTVVRRNRHAPAAATGVTQVGVYAGGVAGPLTFGLLVGELGYPAAWSAAAGALLIAAVLTVVGRSLARRAWLPQTATSG